MDWDKLKSFHLAASLRSLTAAAEALGVAQSSVSRQIAALERELGVVLFHRHARGLEPTEQGALLFTATQKMADQLAAVEGRVRESSASPSGHLLISAPIGFGAEWVSPRLGRFYQRYPDINLELDLCDGPLELRTGRVSAALRLWRPDTPDLVQRSLAELPLGIYARSDLATTLRTASRFEDFLAAPHIAYGPPPSGAPQMGDLNWFASQLNRAGAPAPRLTVNSVLAVRAAIKAGLGVGALPVYLAEADSELTRLAPNLAGPAFTLHYVYAEGLRGSRRLAAFREFVCAELAADHGARITASRHTADA